MRGRGERKERERDQFEKKNRREKERKKKRREKERREKEGRRNTRESGEIVIDLKNFSVVCDLVLMCV